MLNNDYFKHKDYQQLYNDFMEQQQTQQQTKPKFQILMSITHPLDAPEKYMVAASLFSNGQNVFNETPFRCFDTLNDARQFFIKHFRYVLKEFHNLDEFEVI